jgi:hypothetical protein
MQKIILSDYRDGHAGFDRSPHPTSSTTQEMIPECGTLHSDRLTSLR